MQPSKTKHGEWIMKKEADIGYCEYWFECSNCGGYAPYTEDGEEHLTKFCPNCGADMRGEKE